MCKLKIRDFDCWKKIKTKLTEKQSKIIENLHHQKDTWERCGIKTTDY